MARFVFAPRRLADSLPREARAELAFYSFESTLSRSSDVIGPGMSPQGMLFEADPEEIRAKATEFPPDVIVEQEILHYIADLPLTVVVRGNGRSVPARVIARLSHDHWWMGKTYPTIDTDRDGIARFPSPTIGWQLDKVMVEPHHSFWSAVMGPDPVETTADCQPLPDGPLGWWHHAVGIGSPDLQRGAGIRVGVIDAGVGAHDCLQHVRSIGAFIDGGHEPDAGEGHRHGTHVCGLIGARPQLRTQFVGIAPGVDLLSARVLKSVEDGANQLDIANALNALVDQNVDLVNISLAAPHRSAVLSQAITLARNAGVLCFAAAGNKGSAVEYPAALPDVCAVSALGKMSWGPDESLRSVFTPTEPDRFGLDGIFLANFSAWGSNVKCAAPGVGVISTVTGDESRGLYAELSGTSMASPIACGALAAILSSDKEYRHLSTGIKRYERADALLVNGCVTMGLREVFEGNGVPQV